MSLAQTEQIAYTTHMSLAQTVQIAYTTHMGLAQTEQSVEVFDDKLFSVT
jgi:hypothetical protein